MTEKNTGQSTTPASSAPKRHRAIIVGLGNVGAGNGPCGQVAFCYSHLDAYLALKERVEVVGLVDTNMSQLVKAAKRHECEYFGDACDALKALRPDIVSIAVPEKFQMAVMNAVMEAGGVKGIWLEKPAMSEWDVDIPIYVNYIRRAEPVHQKIAALLKERGPDEVVALNVVANGDMATASHFADLTRFWGIPKEKLYYTPLDSTRYVNCEYELILRSEKFKFVEGGAGILTRSPGPSKIWPFPTPQTGEAIAWEPTFMVNALNNLLDAVEGKAELICPCKDAYQSTLLAREVLGG